jgi:tetratricopeptide (TPR) repeat protein
MHITHHQQRFWIKHSLTLLALAAVLSFLAALVCAHAWWQARQLNLAYQHHAIVKQPIALHETQKAYSVGYLQAKNGQPTQAIKSLMIAEASDNPDIRVRAKFALGNLYFDSAIAAANIANGGAHQQAVAHIELAREAYKGALRLKPELHAARFNLELLDRLSPEKRTQGWEAETDGVTLQPFKRNGTAMMRDNKRRGLP